MLNLLVIGIEESLEGVHHSPRHIVAVFHCGAFGEDEDYPHADRTRDPGSRLLGKENTGSPPGFGAPASCCRLPGGDEAGKLFVKVAQAREDEGAQPGHGGRSGELGGGVLVG